MTTWSIEPNWLAWFLFALTAISLLAIAIRVCVPREHEPSPSQNRAEVVAWVAISISIFSAFCVCFKFKDIISIGDGVLVAVLGILVTLLVGWQIWQTLMSKHEVEQATLATRQIGDLRLELFRAKEIAEAHAWNAEAIRMSNNPLKYHEAFQSYADALRHYIRGDADYLNWIHQTFIRMTGLITSQAPTLDHWVIVNRQSVDECFDDLGAEISTMQSNLEEAKRELAGIRELVRAYRISATPTN